MILNDIVEDIDTMVNTRRKRHIVGGVLLSISIMLAGLAITAFSIKDEGETKDE